MILVAVLNLIAQLTHDHQHEFRFVLEPTRVDVFVMMFFAGENYIKHVLMFQLMSEII